MRWSTLSAPGARDEGWARATVTRRGYPDESMIAMRSASTRSAPLSANGAASAVVRLAIVAHDHEPVVRDHGLSAGDLGAGGEHDDEAAEDHGEAAEDHGEVAEDHDRAVVNHESLMELRLLTNDEAVCLAGHQEVP